MDIRELFEAIKSKKVLVIGDVMIDSYLYGKVNRISPEAPVPVINVTRREKRLGGAANVAMNIKALGATPIMCSVVGDDQDGQTFEELLVQADMPKNGIIKSQNRMTTIKHRILSSSQHLLRVDSEDTHPLSDLDRKALQAHVENLLAEVDLVIFEDYDKGAITESLIQSVIAKASELGVPTVVDPKKANFLSYKGATLFKPNLKELKEGLGVEVNPSNVSSIKAAVDKLHETLHTKNYLITLSEHGVYYQNEESHGQQPAHLRSIADVSGAGDTVISIAGLALTLGLPLPFISELSNLGGGIVCESPGVVPIDKTRLMEEAISNKLLEKYQ